MKQLRITLLTVSILAISAFGINECTILIHKANTSGLWRNIQINWNRSLAETGKELNGADDAFITFVSPHRHFEPLGMSDQWKREHGL